MEHYIFNWKLRGRFRQGTGREIWSEFIVPWLLQFAVLYVFIMGHKLIGENGGELAELILMIASLALGVIIMGVSSRLAKAGDDDYIDVIFWMGIVAGILLWQAIGEDAPHYGSEFGNFLNIQGAGALFIMIGFVALLVFAALGTELDWGLSVTSASFLANWAGHFVTIGCYPFVQNIVSLDRWYLVSGIICLVVIFGIGLYLGLSAAKDKKGRMFASIIGYIGVATFIMAMREMM